MEAQAAPVAPDSKDAQDVPVHQDLQELLDLREFPELQPQSHAHLHHLLHVALLPHAASNWFLYRLKE